MGFSFAPVETLAGEQPSALPNRCEVNAQIIEELLAYWQDLVVVVTDGFDHAACLQRLRHREP